MNSRADIRAVYQIYFVIIAFHFSDKSEAFDRGVEYFTIHPPPAWLPRHRTLQSMPPSSDHPRTAAHNSERIKPMSVKDYHICRRKEDKPRRSAVTRNRIHRRENRHVSPRPISAGPMLTRNFQLHECQTLGRRFYRAVLPILG